MTKTSIVPIVCVVGASFLGAVGQYVFKEGSNRAGHGVLSFLLSPWILGGMTCYVSVMALFTYAFRLGGTVTMLYPIYATTFIWGAVIGLLVYGQPIRPIHVAGMMLLVAGIYCMGVGNAAKPPL